MAKKATYWLIGPTEVTLARHKNSFYYVFNKRTGDWIRTERAFDEIVRGMARQIPRITKYILLCLYTELKKNK